MYGAGSGAWTLPQLHHGLLRPNPVVDWFVRGIIGLVERTGLPAPEPVLSGIEQENDALAA